MKTMSILLRKSSLEVPCISQTSLEDIHDYIDYILYPYKQLECFKFNTFTTCPDPIDGNVDSQKLLHSLKCNIHLYRNLPIHLYFKKHNIFLNGESLNFYISLEEYNIIRQNINDYFLFYTHLHN